MYSLQCFSSIVSMSDKAFKILLAASLPGFASFGRIRF